MASAFSLSKQRHMVKFSFEIAETWGALMHAEVSVAYNRRLELKIMKNKIAGKSISECYHIQTSEATS